MDLTYGKPQSENHIEGTNAGPWQSLGHALVQLRKLRPNPPTADSHVTIYLLPGTHYLPSTVSMNKRDSHITIKPLNEDDEVALSGGMVLDGDWEDGEGGIRGAIQYSLEKYPEKYLEKCHDKYHESTVEKALLQYCQDISNSIGLKCS